MRWFRFSWQIVPWLAVIVLSAQLYFSRTDSVSLSGAVSKLSTELSELQNVQEMPATVLRRHRESICYIYAIYTMEWPAKSVVRSLERHTRVSGTGFLVSRDLIATNRHVVEPWFQDPDDEAQIRAGAKPKLEKLVAFFPGMMESVKLGDVRFSRDQDLAVVRLVEGPMPSSFQPLPLADQISEPGDAVIVVGYPLGISAMLAKTPNNLYKRLASTKDTIQVASELAAHSLIRPSATCGHLGDIVGEKLIYDAPTAQGGSGGPVFNSRGKVIAVNAAYIDGFSGGTIGISANSLKPLIAASERRW